MYWTLEKPVLLCINVRIPWTLGFCFTPISLRLFLCADMMSPAQVLAEIEIVEFNEDDRVQSQIENMNITIGKSKGAFVLHLFLRENSFCICFLADFEFWNRMEPH